MKALAAAALALALATPGMADPVKILDATATRTGEFWTITVTIAHPDAGWDHYAEGWEVLSPSGDRLAWRELSHPHVGEDAVTRSVEGVMVPDGADHVMIRSRCSLSGWAPETFRLELNAGTP